MENKGTVVILSVVHWNMTWQNVHNLAAGFANRGYQVYFVEPIPKRWPRISELKRVWGRLTDRKKSTGVCYQKVPLGISIVSPRILPDAGSIPTWINQHFFVPRLALGLKQRGLSKPVIMVHYVPISAALNLQSELHPDVAIYSCIHDWPNDPHTNRTWVEKDLFHRVDMVWADSETNMSRATQFHPKVLPLKNAVSVDDFVISRGIPGVRKRRPLCGYFGMIGFNIDIELLREVSRHYPLRLIGPSRYSLDNFSSKTEIIGAVPHEKLPMFLQDVDVLLLPYGNAPHVAGIMPAKIFEYLATGKPIVSIGLEELGEFQDLIYICRTKEEFISTISRSMFEDSTLPQARIERAKENSWTRRLERVDDMIKSLLVEKGLY